MGCMVAKTVYLHVLVLVHWVVNVLVLTWKGPALHPVRLRHSSTHCIVVGNSCSAPADNLDSAKINQSLQCIPAGKLS